jgi:hypothetical protein
MSRKTIITVSIVGGIVLVLFIMVMSIPDDPLTVEDGTFTLAIGPIAVPVASPEPAAEDPNQYLGVPGPKPDFDTTDLGGDLSLRAGTPDFTALDIERIVRPDRILRAVYLGDDQDGVPVYTYAEGSNNFLNLLCQIILGQGSIGRLGSTYHCCTPGPLPDNAYGLPILELTVLIEGKTILTAEWHGLPDTISVVALEINGEPIGWQRTNSGTTAIRVEIPDLDDPEAATMTMIAYDAQGTEQART